MAVKQLPLRTDGYPYYDFEITLDEIDFTFEFYWNERSGRWYMNIYDIDNNPLFTGICIVADWDLLTGKQVEGMPLGTLITVDTDGQGDPGLYDLGKRVLITYNEALS